MNHFQNMPALPGCSEAPAISVGGKKIGKAGKGKGKNKSKKVGNDSSPKASRKRKGDPELLQLDLKRQQLNITRATAPCLETNPSHPVACSSGNASGGVERLHRRAACFN